MAANDVSHGVRLVRVPEDRDGQRLDNFLLLQLKGAPRSLVYKLVRSGQVRINGKRAKADTRLAGGDEVRIPPVRLGEPGEAAAPPKARMAIAGIRRMTGPFETSRKERLTRHGGPDHPRPRHAGNPGREQCQHHRRHRGARHEHHLQPVGQLGPFDGREHRLGRSREPLRFPAKARSMPESTGGVSGP